MDLPSHSCDHDRQAAEAINESVLASLVKPGSFYLYLPIYMFDKGKPAEKQGRKAMDLPSRNSVTMTARLPKTTISVCVPVWAPLSTRKQ